MATSFIAWKSASLSILVGCLILVGTSDARSIQGHDHDSHSHAAEKASEEKGFSGDPYLLGIDPVSGKALGAVDKQVIVQHEGRELRFAGERTAATFQADPAKYLPAVDAKLIEQQLPFYPLDTCAVSGEELGGDMGEPVNIIYKNRLVRFCCKGCKKSFIKSAGAHIAKMDKAVAEKQGKEYPLTTCVVSGGKLGSMGDPVDYVVGNRLIRLCCKGCKKRISKDPLAYLAKLDAAAGGERHHAKKGHDGEHGDHGRHDG